MIQSFLLPKPVSSHADRFWNCFECHRVEWGYEYVAEIHSTFRLMLCMKTVCPLCSPFVSSRLVLCPFTIKVTLTRFFLGWPLKPSLTFSQRKWKRPPEFNLEAGELVTVTNETARRIHACAIIFRRLPDHKIKERHPLVHFKWKCTNNGWCQPHLLRGYYAPLHLSMQHV